MIKHKSHRSIFFLCATLLWVGLWAGSWMMVPNAPVYAQAESTAADEENADTSADEEQAVEEKAPAPPKNLRSTEIKGMLPGGEFAKIWLGLEPAFFSANINIFAEWDRPNALRDGLGFYILDEAGLRDVVNGQQQSRNVSIASGDDVFEGFDHQMDATFKAPAQAKYTIVIFNDSQGDANFTMNASNAFILDDGGQVEDLSEPSEDEEAAPEEGDESSDTEEEASTEELPAEEPTEIPEPTETPVVVEEAEEVEEEAASETVADEAAPELEQGMPKVVEEMVLSGDLPTQFSMHFLGVRPSTYNGTIKLHLQFDPRDNSEILRKLNFWVLDARSLQLYFDPSEDVRLHEIANAAGSPTFRGFSNERAASFQALQLSEYTVIVYNDANVPGNYILTVEDGILIDRDNQTNEALQGGSVDEEETAAETDQETEETAAEDVAAAPVVAVEPEVPTPVPPTVAPIPPTAMPVPPTAAPIGPPPTLAPPSLPPTPVPPPPPPTPVPPMPVPPTPVPPPPPPTPVPPPPPPLLPAPVPVAVTNNTLLQPPAVNPAPIINVVPEPGLMLNPLFVPILPGFEFAPGITPQPFFIPDPNYVPPTPAAFVPDTNILPQPVGVEPAPLSPPAIELPPTPVPLPTSASAAPVRGVPGGTYVVQSGDSAALIARDIYGDYKFFSALCSFNGLSNCNVIEVGDVLNLPTQEQISAGIETPSTSTSSTSTSSSTSAVTTSTTTENIALPTEAPTAVPTEVPTAVPAVAAEPEPLVPSTLTATESLDIVDTLIGTGNFKNLVTALEATNLSAPLRTPGPFTLFAPSDAAFDALPAGALQQLLANPEGQLTQILLYHVIPGQLYSNALGDGEEVPTQQGSSIFFEVSDNFITVNGANVSVFDIQSTNGVIHVIDAVILPPID